MTTIRPTLGRTAGRSALRRRIATLAIAAPAALVLATGSVAAADGSGINSGDTAWLLVATALVMLMLPGLALFYGGLVRRKNVLSTIMHSFFGLAIVSVVWVLWGYSLAFGPDSGNGLIGRLDFLGFSNVGLTPDPRYSRFPTSSLPRSS